MVSVSYLRPGESEWRDGDLIGTVDDPIRTKIAIVRDRENPEERYALILSRVRLAVELA